MLILVPDEKIDRTEHLTMDLESISTKLIIADRGTVLQNNQLIPEEKTGKPYQEEMYSSKIFNSNYIEFDGYETNEKLIWTSGEGCINTNKSANKEPQKIISA